MLKTYSFSLILVTLMLIIGCKPTNHEKISDTSPTTYPSRLENEVQNSLPNPAEAIETAKEGIVQSGIVIYKFKTFIMNYPFFPPHIMSMFDKKGSHMRYDMHLRYILIPHRLINEFMINPNKYLDNKLFNWSEPNGFGKFSFMNIESQPEESFLTFFDKSFTLNFTDAHQPTITVIQNDGSTRLKDEPLMRGDEILYSFAHWSASDADVQDLNKTFPALKVNPGEQFHIFIALRTTGGPDVNEKGIHYNFYTIPANFSHGIKDIMYT